jgi:antitoxin (DNA-binding transcriptional repressor) of toxin-antitoxin stability system
MKSLKTAGVKELKNNLSSYLREVRGGATILVTDRNDIIAELHEPYGRPGISGTANPLLMTWVDEGIVTLPAIDKEPLPRSPVHLPEGTVNELLENDRKESGE